MELFKRMFNDDTSTLWFYAYFASLHIGVLFLAPLSFDEPLALYFTPLLILGFASSREWKIKKNYMKKPQPITTNVNIKV